MIDQVESKEIKEISKEAEKIVVDSYSERRRVRESLGQVPGENRYGGKRCQCQCGDIHWRKPEAVKVEMR